MLATYSHGRHGTKPIALRRQVGGCTLVDSVGDTSGEGQIGRGQDGGGLGTGCYMMGEGKKEATGQKSLDRDL